MKLVDNRAQIEAQFKSVNVTDLTLSGAQRALTYKPAGGDGNSGGNGNGSGGGTPAGDYDKLEEKLIAKLKELNANEAKAHAAADSLAEQLADVEAARHALKNGQQCSEKRGRLDWLFEAGFAERLEDAINRSERAKVVKMIEGQVNEEVSE